jgi:hypothetical protein
LAALEEKLFSNLFKTVIKNDVQDETPLIFDLEVVAEHNSFHKTIKVVVQAPKLKITDIKMGKLSGTSAIEPGDKINIEIELSNIGHNVINDLFAVGSVYFSGVELSDHEYAIIKIEAGKSVSVSFRGKIDKFVSVGDIIPFYFSALKGAYTIEEKTFIVIGNLIEDFETGDFSKFDWEQGENPWEITTSNVYEGKFCARSKTNLNDNCVSQLKISTYVPFASTASYFRRVSSEAGFDFFNFYIDNKLKEDLSGESMGIAAFEVESGEHTFTFEYSKDAYISEGADCAWIDNISIPGMGKLVAEDLPKIKVINYVIEDLDENNMVTGATNIRFDLKNASLVNANLVTAELSCNFPELLIVAENSTTNQTLPFSIEMDAEESVSFDLKPMLLRNLEKKSINFLFTVSSNRGILYYPFVLEFAHLQSAFPDKSVLLFPNPAQTTLTILSKNPIVSYQIIDIKGNVVNSCLNFNNYIAQINVAPLAAGVYFVKTLDTFHTFAIQKFVKQ